MKPLQETITDKASAIEAGGPDAGNGYPAGLPFLDCGPGDGSPDRGDN